MCRQPGIESIFYGVRTSQPLTLSSLAGGVILVSPSIFDCSYDKSADHGGGSTNKRGKPEGKIGERSERESKIFYETMWKTDKFFEEKLMYPGNTRTRPGRRGDEKMAKIGENKITRQTGTNSVKYFGEGSVIKLLPAYRKIKAIMAVPRPSFAK